MTNQNILLIIGFLIITLFSISLVSAGCEGLYSCRSPGILSTNVKTFQQDGKNYATITTDACVYSFGVCRKDIYPFVQYTWKGTNASNFNPIKSPRLDMRDATLLLGDTRCAQFANAYCPSPQVYRYDYTFQFANSGTFPLYIYTLDLTPNNNCKDDLGRFDDKTISLLIPEPEELSLNIVSPENITYENSSVLVDIISNGQVKFSIDSGSEELYNSSFTREFSQGSHNLTAIAEDEFGNSKTQSVVFTVQANPQEIVISGIEGSVTNSSATFTWTTNIPSDSFVYYDLNEDLELISGEYGYSTSHSITISNLASNTTYYYEVSSCNENDCAHTDILNFTTLANQVNSALPDLFIDNGYLPGGQTCENDSEVRFHTNTNGAIMNNSIPVRASLDGVVLNLVNSLPFPASTGVFDWGIGFGYLNPGMHNLTIITDPDNTISESNENNNLFQFTFNVTAQNQCNPDTTPPAKITNFSYTATNSSISLSWTNPTDSDFNGTIIFLNNNQIATLNKTISHYTITGLNQNTTYNITIATIDTSGNQNPVSFSVTTAIGNQTTPPVTPIVIHHTHTTSVIQSTPQTSEEATPEIRYRGESIGNLNLTTLEPISSQAQSAFNYTAFVLLLALACLALFLIILILVYNKR